VNQELVRLCDDLVTQEETHLQETLAALHQVRQLMVVGPSETLAGALASALNADALVAQVQHRRTHFRQSASAMLGVPAGSVTLRAAAEALPPEEGRRVLDRRRRLQELATEVDRANHANALVVWWCMDFVQQVFAELKGSPLAGRYGADGKVQTAGFGPTWQSQG